MRSSECSSKATLRRWWRVAGHEGAPSRGASGSRIFPREYGWFSVLLDRLARVLSRRVDCIMYNSQRGRAVHERHGFPPAKGTLIENAVDAHVFVRNPQLGASLRSEMGIGSEAIVVGIVARLDAAKDHETFLQAAALLRRHNSTMQLLVVGADVGERKRAFDHLLRISALMTLSISSGHEMTCLPSTTRAPLLSQARAPRVFQTRSSRRWPAAVRLSRPTLATAHASLQT